MTTRIVVPDLGESVVEATVGEWLKKEGDRVEAGEPLVSLETDKVDLDVAATQSGVLGKIERKTGEDVKIGDLLAVIEEEGGQAAPAKSAPQAEQNGKGPAPAAEPAASKTEVTPKAEIPKVEDAKADGANVEEANLEEAKVDGAESESRATPVAKRMAAEKGVDIGEIAGAGPGGRVTKHDVESYVQ